MPDRLNVPNRSMFTGDNLEILRGPELRLRGSNLRRSAAQLRQNTEGQWQGLCRRLCL